MPMCFRIGRQDFLELFDAVFDVADTERKKSINLEYDIYPDLLETLDYNYDGRLNLQDVYIAMQRRVGHHDHLLYYIIAQLSRNVDKNQDGVLHYNELKTFITNMFDVLDVDNDDDLTLDDLFQLLLDNQVPVDQVHSLETSVSRLVRPLRDIVGRAAADLFPVVDADGDGAATREEMYGVTTGIRHRNRGEWTRINCESPGGRGGLRSCQHWSPYPVLRVISRMDINHNLGGQELLLVIVAAILDDQSL